MSKDGTEQSIFGQTSIIDNLSKLMEYIKTIKPLIQTIESNEYDADSFAEEWIEILNEVINIIQNNFDEIKLVNVQKFLLTQLIFCVLLYQSPLFNDKKYISSVKVVIDLIDQSNLILISSIIDTLTPKEKKLISQQVSK